MQLYNMEDFFFSILISHVLSLNKSFFELYVPYRTKTALIDERKLWDGLIDSVLIYLSLKMYSVYYILMIEVWIVSNIYFFNYYLHTYT